MVPHAARLLAGADLRRALPVAALLGGCLVVLADLAGRIVWPGGEIPAGIVTALLGGPVLLAWFVRGHRA
jgi:iron complex transport system permease protein